MTFERMSLFYLMNQTHTTNYLVLWRFVWWKLRTMSFDSDINGFYMLPLFFFSV